MLQVFVGNQPILVEEGGHTFFAQVTFYSSVNFLVALKAGIVIKFFSGKFHRNVFSLLHDDFS